MSDPDRRRAQRIAFQEYVSVVVGNDFYEVPAITENLSSAGVLVYTDRRIQEGSEVGLILVVPPAEAEGKRMWCLGKVLRVEKELKEGSAWLSDFSFAKYCPRLRAVRFHPRIDNRHALAIRRVVKALDHAQTHPRLVWKKPRSLPFRISAIKNS